MILETKAFVEHKLNELTERVNALSNKPTLALIRVGEDPASAVYVRNKVRRCHEVGVETLLYHLATDVSEDEVADLIYHLNINEQVTGILLQLPLPKHLNEHKLTNLIDPLKDVDGLTTVNAGRLSENLPCTPTPCTPRGIIEFLSYNNFSLQSKDVLIISRSNIVGKPMAQVCLNHDATVTIAHSKTNNLREKILNADIIIVAAGKPNLIDKELLHELNNSNNQKLIIDVSINYVELVNSTKRIMCGDVVKDPEFVDSLDNIYVTPVPNGVGQLTVLALLETTIEMMEGKS